MKDQKEEGEGDAETCDMGASKIRALFGSPCNKDHSILGCILALSICGNPQIEEDATHSSETALQVLVGGLCGG